MDNHIAAMEPNSNRKEALLTGRRAVHAISKPILFCCPAVLRLFLRERRASLPEILMQICKNTASLAGNPCVLSTKGVY